MLATSLGPGKEYTHTMLATVLASLCGVAESVLVLDDVGPPANHQAFGRTPFIWLVQPRSLSLIGRIAGVREAARQHFLRSDCTHLYWHDSDMAPPRDIIPRLLAHGAPVANGFYAVRGCDPNNPILPFMTRLLDPDEPKKPTVEMDELAIGEDGLIYPLACGMGCMLVDRRTMEATPFAEPESFAEDAYGEDIQWCLDSGKPILIDTTLPVWHIDSDGSGVLPGIAAS
jgi:hypothetical protein